MNNAESNEPKDKQAQRAGESPVKVPETETAHLKVEDAAKAASGQEAGLGQARGSGASKSGDAGVSGGPLGLTTRHPVGQDVLNDESLDDTVDTDGKNRDAKRDMEMREREPDSVITSNATLVNYVGEPGDGLGGFDSRPGRNGLLLALEHGYRMIDKGMVAPQVTEVEHRQQFEARDPHGHTLRGRKHYALNHMRPSRLIELQRRDK
ncbi:DUF3005 domain-containing protein [Caballeronia telluris]|uniref:2-oxoglutarate dehydrogenase n=1 Tax=Caballeronia telluris TaxID=326475 RepID=A0A158JC88_9BURK|nr:DUF3005 domain-containing protein [Caballeronia telluris]SAL66464.1 2-oxoglutarate dehydrogenase [Caballeronia telluris]